MTRGKYRVEHVDERPRGWRVRTKLSGRHVLRVGFPPGPRRRGSGRLLEVLHPREENNPSCPVTARAKANPESLVIFGLGNPDREQLRERLKAAQARFSAISQKQSELRRRLKPEHGERYILTPEWSALEPESDAAYKALESAKRAMNPRRKHVSQITDRAKRYRGNANMPPGEKRCAACGRKPNRIDVMHVDGHEQNNAQDNLMYGCRSCNVKMANTLRRAGMGTKTRQFNPSGGAQTLAQWVTAVMSLKGESDQIPLGEAIDIIRATPASRRSSFAKQIWQRRRRKNPQESPAARKRKEGETIVGACPHCEKLFTAREVEAGESLRHLSKHRAERESQHRGDREQNPIRMQIEPDPSHKQFRASMKHPSGGSWLYAWGHTQKQAAARLRDEWRKARGKNPAGAWRVSTYQLFAGDGSGRPVRKATKVTAPDGREVKFVERMSKRSAIAQAKHHLGIANPRRRRRHNQVSETEQAVKLFEIFHGKDPAKIVDKHVSAAMRKDYTALGKLVAVGLEDNGYGEREIAAKWDKCNHISFAEDGVTLASSSDGRQLYAIGGNQNLNGCLEKFQGVDPAKDFIDLGEVVFVVYEARKVHDNFEPVEYVHKFGGHGNTRPGWFYDRLKKAVFFIGGEYFIDVDAKISPGIEG